MRDKYPYSLGPDGFGKFFLCGDDGREKEVKVSEADQERVEKALKSLVDMLEKMEGVKNAPKESALDEEEKFLKWLEDTIIPLEAVSDTDPHTLREIERLKKEMKSEIDSEMVKISEEKKKRPASCIFDDNMHEKGPGAAEALKTEKKDNKTCVGGGGPIFIDCKPLKYKEAPKYETISFKEALEKERKEIEEKNRKAKIGSIVEALEKDKEETEGKNIDYKKGTCAFSGTDANKHEKILFRDTIDGDGNRCYIAYPFGKFNRGKWSDNVESIHVNDDTLVIKSRVYLESEIPDFKESLVRVVRAKLPLDSDYSTVTASCDKYFGLCIKVLKKHFEKRSQYTVNID